MIHKLDLNEIWTMQREPDNHKWVLIAGLALLVIYITLK